MGIGLIFGIYPLTFKRTIFTMNENPKRFHRREKTERSDFVPDKF